MGTRLHGWRAEAPKLHSLFSKYADPVSPFDLDAHLRNYGNSVILGHRNEFTGPHTGRLHESTERAACCWVTIAIWEGTVPQNHGPLEQNAFISPGQLIANMTGSQGHHTDSPLFFTETQSGIAFTVAHDHGMIPTNNHGSGKP